MIFDMQNRADALFFAMMYSCAEGSCYAVMYGFAA